MTSSSAVIVDYIVGEPTSARILRACHGTLGAVCYRTPAVSPAPGGASGLRIGLPPLPHVESCAVHERWQAAGTMKTDNHGHLRCAHGGGWLFGGIQVGESPGDDGPRAALGRAVMQAYAAMFECLHAHGLRRAVRIWNFLADINREVDGVERYRVFNEARQRAFAAAAEQVRRDVPAASAVGTPAGEPFTLYFMASDTPGTPLENPRQVAAYDYPSDYGACSPTFARAALAHVDDGMTLFVSGTASIVGHRSLHPRDVAAQTRETIANLAAVLQAANGHVGRQCFRLEDLALKAYVRHAADQLAVAAELQRLVRPRRDPVYLQADICRAELLVEIEAVAMAGTVAA